MLHHESHLTTSRKLGGKQTSVSPQIIARSMQWCNHLPVLRMPSSKDGGGDEETTGTPSSSELSVSPLGDNNYVLKEEDSSEPNGNDSLSNDGLKKQDSFRESYCDLPCPGLEQN